MKAKKKCVLKRSKLYDIPGATNCRPVCRTIVHEFDSEFDAFAVMRYEFGRYNAAAAKAHLLFSVNFLYNTALVHLSDGRRLLWTIDPVA